jgi:hypothetical protein
VVVGETELQVSASMGVTFFRKAEAIEADQLLRQADQAMYQAKAGRQEPLHVFDNARQQHPGTTRAWNAFAWPLERNEFVLHYQPKVNMRTGKVVGAEALIRWQHPDKGLLAPAAFLPVIEDHPLAVTLGEWVIEAALAQIDTWLAAGLTCRSASTSVRASCNKPILSNACKPFWSAPPVTPWLLELEVLETSALKTWCRCQTIEGVHEWACGLPGRLWHRVFVAHLPEAFARGRAQNRPEFCARHARRPGRPGHFARRDWPGCNAFKREVIAEGVETAAHGTAAATGLRPRPGLRHCTPHATRAAGCLGCPVAGTPFGDRCAGLTWPSDIAP